MLPYLNSNNKILVLYGDVPLIQPSTLNKLVKKLDSADLMLISAKVPNPKGFGRVIRDNNDRVVAIREHRDANAEELVIGEINSGVVVASREIFAHYLPKIENLNAKNEYYLTDIINLLVQDHRLVGCLRLDDYHEIAGINDKLQLAELERFYQTKRAYALMIKGLGVIDPARFDLRGELKFGQDVIIDINVVMEGKVILGENVTIGQNSFVKNSRIGSRVIIKPNTVIEDAIIGDDCTIGPFARIRPGTKMAAGVRVGNFVEVKNSFIGRDSKVAHLSYIGDTIIDRKVNIGAGTITCNYDGVNKHSTFIGAEAFIGSNTSLVAPLKIGVGATIGAGSVITKDAPNKSLTLARSKQLTIKCWQPKEARRQKFKVEKEVYK